MANTVDNTMGKIGNTIEAIFGKPEPQQPTSNSVNTDGKQTCLERFGIEARKYHILRNEWRKDLEYSKSLVDAEYMIQTEFKIGDSPQEMKRQKEIDEATKLNREREKQDAAKRKEEKKAQKAAEKEAKKAAKVGKVAQKDNTNTTTTVDSSNNLDWVMQYGGASYNPFY
jgi:superfamily II DNA or RNA helicase